MMPVRHTYSRDGSTSSDTILRMESSNSLKEPLLSLAESGTLSTTNSTNSPLTNRNNRISPTIMSHRRSFSSSNGLDTLKLPNLMASSITGSSSNGNNTTAAGIMNSNNHNHHYHQFHHHRHPSNPSALSAFGQQLLSSASHNPDVGLAVAIWYVIGVLSICTTKLLLSTPIEEGGVPSPLVMTFQQMVLGSTFVRLFLGSCYGHIQPWPKENSDDKDDKSHPAPIYPTISLWGNWSQSYWCQLSTYANAVDFLALAGLFNALDFLASNTSFSHSSASFVETIKASEPITTTVLAVWWGIDRLGKRESLSLAILIAGVLMSTYANANADPPSTTIITDDITTTTTAISITATTATSAPSLVATLLEEVPSLADSIKTCLTVMTANICFAFRAMSQKLFRNSPTGSCQQLDDFNLLYRMHQTGAVAFVVPVMLFQPYTLLQVMFGRPSWSVFGYYVGVSVINAWAFATYSLASCYILTRISVVQYSGLGCLRRLFAIVVTSITFGVPISWLGLLGILMSLFGFSAFTHYRFQRQGQSKKGEADVGEKQLDGNSCVADGGGSGGYNNGNMETASTCSVSGIDTAPLSAGSGSSLDG